MKIRCRCNKRECQARRNLNKRPDQYVYPPRCHQPGCEGFMYVDEYRQRKGSKDHPPECVDMFCDYNRVTGNKNKRHRISNHGCVSYEAYKIDCSFSQSKHSPAKPEVSGDAPF